MGRTVGRTKEEMRDGKSECIVCEKSIFNKKENNKKNLSVFQGNFSMTKRPLDPPLPHLGKPSNNVHTCGKMNSYATSVITNDPKIFDPMYNLFLSDLFTLKYFNWLNVLKFKTTTDNLLVSLLEI